MVDTPRIAFEAVKIAWSQNKDGYALTLRIHPDDVSIDLMRLPYAQRVGVALVTIGDDGVAPGVAADAEKHLKDGQVQTEAKAKYEALEKAIFASPYAAIWAEENGFDLVGDAVEAAAYEKADTWVDRLEALRKVQKEVASYA